MKNKNIIYLVLLLVLFGAKSAFSACPTFTPANAGSIVQVKDILANYNCFLDTSTDTYLLDFSKNTTPLYTVKEVSLALNNTSEKYIKITGLNLQFFAGKDPSSLYIALLGSNIIIENSSFVRPTSDASQGIAIQIGDGINPTSQITIGAGNVFTNFATGINVAQNANAKITQNTFANVATPIADESSSPTVISADWFGKHTSETDATKVDRIAGKLDLTECKGSVEMYLKKRDFDLYGKIYPLQYHTDCLVAELKGESLKLIATDKPEKEIAVGACYFDCDKLDILKDNYVSFTYTSASNQTSSFVPKLPIKIDDLMDVIGLGGIIAGQTTTGMNNTDGETAGPPIVVPEFPPPADGGSPLVDPAAKKETADGKTQVDGTTPPASTSDKVGSGSSGGCGGGQNISASEATDPLQIVLTFISGLGLVVPVAYRRIRKLNRCSS